MVHVVLKTFCRSQIKEWKRLLNHCKINYRYVTSLSHGYLRAYQNRFSFRPGCSHAKLILCWTWVKHMGSTRIRSEVWPRIVVRMWKQQGNFLFKWSSEDNLGVIERQWSFWRYGAMKECRHSYMEHWGMKYPSRNWDISWLLWFIDIFIIIVVIIFIIIIIIISRSHEQ